MPQCFLIENLREPGNSPSFVHPLSTLATQDNEKKLHRESLASRTKQIALNQDEDIQQSYVMPNSNDSHVANNAENSRLGSFQDISQTLPFKAEKVMLADESESKHHMTCVKEELIVERMQDKKTIVLDANHNFVNE